MFCFVLFFKKKNIQFTLHLLIKSLIEKYLSTEDLQVITWHVV